MPNEPSGAAVGLPIAAGMLTLAVLFATRIRIERGRRGPDLSPADARHFARQDARRLLGAAIMGLIALGMTAGLWIDPRAGRAAGKAWAAIWLAVSALILALLGLALLDWFAILGYARRHRRALLDERRALIEAERRRAALGDGRGRAGNPIDRA